MGSAADVAIVGGCGHVGLPLGIAFASSGMSVVLYDIDDTAVQQVSRGEMPFMEELADEALAKYLDAGTLTATTDPISIRGAEHVVVVVGTPIDDHLNPDPTRPRR